VAGWLTARRKFHLVACSVLAQIPELLELIPARVSAEACDVDDQVRSGAWVAKLTDLPGLADLDAGDPTKGSHHPGARLQITGIDGHHVAAFVTNTRVGGRGTQLPTSNCATRAGPGVRTACKPPGTPGRARPRCLAPRRTRPRAASSPLPHEARLERTCSACTAATSPAWNLNGRAYACSTCPTLARTGRRVLLLPLADEAPWAGSPGKPPTDARPSPLPDEHATTVPDKPKKQPRAMESTPSRDNTPVVARRYRKNRSEEKRPTPPRPSSATGRESRETGSMHPWCLH